MSASSPSIVDSVFSLPLERSASVRKFLPELSSGWLLDEYIVGAENSQLKYLFAEENIRKLGALSPILFYGDRSLGKTTLAISLGVRWSRLLKERPVCFLTGQDFCSQYANAVEIDDIASFRRKLRGAKLLVLDGLEPVFSKLAAQQELAATLDALCSLDWPVIITSGGLPLTSCGVQPYLASRLSGGFSMQLAKPGKETRHALIQQLITRINPLLPADALMRLADDLSADQPLSPLQLADLVKLGDQNCSADGDVNLIILKSLMVQHLKSSSPSVASITKSVCRRLHVKLADVRGTCRRAYIVRARGLAILLARRFTTLSLFQIGNYFGGRDHSTILHSIRKTASLLSDDPELANSYRDVEAELLSR